MAIIPLETSTGKVKVATAKFNINYIWANRDIFEKTKADLVKEGWKVTNYTEPANPYKTDPTASFTCWFERIWEIDV